MATDNDATDHGAEDARAPARPQDIPVAGFQAMAVDAKVDLNPARELAKALLGYALEDKVLEDTPLRDVDGVHLHAYMMRRFGPPHVGGGGHMLTAAWVLSTPDPGTFVEVCPVTGGPGFNFVPRVVDEDERMVSPRDRKGLPRERQEAIAAAYRATLIDLLRPVRVDSVHINPTGQVDEYDPDLGGDPDGEEANPVALDAHPSCGYATPLGACDGPGWERLWSLVEDLGGGDPVAGRDAVIALMMDRVVAALGAEPLPVRLLVCAHLRGADADRCREALALSEPEIAEAGAIREALEAAWGHRPYQPMRDLDDADVARATRLLATLGMHTPIMNALERNRAGKRNKDLSEAFHALGDYPGAALPKTLYPSQEEVAELPQRLLEAGREEMAYLVLETLRQPGGDGPVYDLMQRAWWDADQRSKKA